MHTDQITPQGIGPADITALLAIEPHLDESVRDQAATDAFGNALSIVAHDLKGPLANLALLVEDISRSAEDGAVPRIARKAESADRIIGQMSLMLSAVLERARNGRDPLSGTMAIVNLVEVLQLAFAVNQPAARRKSITFRCLAIDPLIVRGDQELLFEAFDNLIGNAVRHSPEGGTITCETGPADEGWLQVRISDAGSGFKAADLLRAFRPFVSLSGIPAGGKGSSGLGLWITRLIAERHGGRVSAHNHPDRGGAVMTVRLPVVQPGAASHPSPSEH
ncbi:sensor histidine kinase KdpD [uncultured Roseibium sp.]|uniref:sensor histidine kinase n=1 Tax=uncultured Roseibium sp. TaxID=1936171 RepID=UPI00261FFDAD|nr:HAMP domain-containing sensor histidine kinase [uncultured Roseibium sp.]